MKALVSKIDDVPDIAKKCVKDATKCDEAVKLSEEGIKNNFKGVDKAGIELNLRLIDDSIQYINDPELVKKHVGKLKPFIKDSPEINRVFDKGLAQYKKAMIPDKTKFLQKINIGDPIHITSQNNLKGILNKGLKQSDGMYGEGVYHSTVLKTKTGNKFVPLLKGVGEDEIAVKLRIKNKEKYRHIDDEKFQGRFLEDIPIKDIEIFDPKTNDWIGLQVLKDNLEKYNYLIEPL